jgi:hypothetical protein
MVIINILVIGKGDIDLRWYITLPFIYLSMLYKWGNQKDLIPNYIFDYFYIINNFKIINCYIYIY